MSWKQGGCHCGAVRFEVLAPRRDRGQRVQLLDLPQGRLSASHRREGALPPAQGEDKLTTYTFNTGTAKHHFCSVCGIKSFYVPRSKPDGFSVNVRCLDDGQVRVTRIALFDGQHWEEALWPPRAGTFEPCPRNPHAALSPTMEEGKLAKWHVKEGDRSEAATSSPRSRPTRPPWRSRRADEGRSASSSSPKVPSMSR